jgi:hypothetical protein
MSKLMVSYKHPSQKPDQPQEEEPTDLFIRRRFQDAMGRIYGKEWSEKKSYFNHPYRGLVSKGLDAVRAREQYWVNHLAKTTKNGKSALTDQGDHYVKGQIRKLRILRSAVFEDEEPILPTKTVGQQLSIFSYTYEEGLKRETFSEEINEGSGS